MDNNKALVLRTCKADGTSYGGFRWPSEVGAIVTAPDWSSTPTCGGGLHGLLDGIGDYSLLSADADAIWQVVEVERAACVEIGGMVKFPNCRLVYRGGVAGAMALISREWVRIVLASPAAGVDDYSPAASAGNHSPSASVGYYSPAASAGNYSPSASAGFGSPAVSAGNCSPVASAGHYSLGVSAGDCSPAVSAGRYSQAVSAGCCSPAVSAGRFSPAVSAGRCSQAVSAGDWSPATATGTNSIAAALGVGARAKAGSNGCVIVRDDAEDRPREIGRAHV